MPESKQAAQSWKQGSRWAIAQHAGGRGGEEAHAQSKGMHAGDDATVGGRSGGRQGGMNLSGLPQRAGQKRQLGTPGVGGHRRGWGVG